MKVNFLEQPFLLCVVDIIRYSGNMRPYKVLSYVGKLVTHERAVVAVGRITNYNNWNQSYRVSPWM